MATTTAHPPTLGRGRRVRLTVAGAVLAALSLAACEPGTVAIGFDPAVGDVFHFRSEVTTEVERTIEGEADFVADDATLTLREVVTSLAADEVSVEVTVRRAGATPRTFEVNLDRAGRLSGIVLVEGVPTEALGLDLGADLPAGIAGPPVGPLKPGTRWQIVETVAAPGIAEPLRITGRGEIAALGVEDGHDVASAVVHLDVPVRSVVETPDGRVLLTGRQTTVTRTAYDLEDGAVWRERTDVRGTVDVIVEPPAGVAATPLRGAIVYRVRVDTVRVETPADEADGG